MSRLSTGTATIWSQPRGYILDSAAALPPSTSFLLLEDGVSYLLLEDGSSKLLLESNN